jgi:hypothetical protein
LAAIDLGTAKVAAWGPKPDFGFIGALALTPTTLYAGGIGGLGAFDTGKGAPLSWRAQASGASAIVTMDAIAVFKSSVFVGDDGGLEVFPNAA